MPLVLMHSHNHDHSSLGLTVPKALPQFAPASPPYYRCIAVEKKSLLTNVSTLVPIVFCALTLALAMLLAFKNKLFSFCCLYLFFCSSVYLSA